MHATDRRAALGLAAVASALLAAAPTAADTYPPTAGEEVAPGVREVLVASSELLEYAAELQLPGSKLLWMTDLVFQPGATLTLDVVPNHMICHVRDGLLRVDAGELASVIVKPRQVWALRKGSRASLTNSGAGVAVLRVIDLLPG
jgi:hypothetical protein